MKMWRKRRKRKRKKKNSRKKEHEMTEDNNVDWPKISHIYSKPGIETGR